MTDDDVDRRRVDMTPAAECYLLSKYRLLLPMQLCCLPLPCPPHPPPPFLRVELCWCPVSGQLIVRGAAAVILVKI